MRIAYVILSPFPTSIGAGYQTAKMCEALAQAGCAVTLLHPSRRPTDPLSRLDAAEAYGVRANFAVRQLPHLDVVPHRQFLDRIGVPWLQAALAFLWGLSAAVAARRIGANLCITRHLEVAYWSIRVGIPTVYEMHIGVRPRRARLMGAIAGHPSLRLVVALTPYLRDDAIAAGVPADRVITLPDAVDLAAYEALPDPPECRRRLGLPQQARIVGYVGRFTTMGMEKGLGYLVQAIGLLPGVHLVAVGGPLDALPEYLRMAQDAGVPSDHIRLLDRVPTRLVPLWIRACDVVTIPWGWTQFSAYWTSPLKMFEYMASGVPIVASDLPALRAVLRHGQNAWLVPPGDPVALAEGIRALLDHPDAARTLASQARADVSAHTWSRRASRLLEAVAT